MTGHEMKKLDRQMEVVDRRNRRRDLAAIDNVLLLMGERKIYPKDVETLRDRIERDLAAFRRKVFER